MEKVTIIIPVYNVEKYIKKCLVSVINQTYKNIEILVVNDGTKDNSVEVIKKIIKETSDERIKLLEKENGGLSSARNYGLNHASGKYIMFVDSDDTINPYMVEKMVDKIEKYGLDMVETNFCYLYEQTKKIENVSGTMYDNKKEFLAKGRVLVSNKIFRRNIIEKNKLRFQEGVYYEDIGFTNKYILNSKKIGFIDYVGYNYLQRKNSITGSNNFKGKLDIINVFENLIEYYIKNNFYEEYYNELEYLITRIILGSSFKRMLKINVRTKKEKEEKIKYIEKTYSFLIEKFPNYKKNKYLNNKNGNNKKKEKIKNIILKLLNLNIMKLIAKLYKS